MKAYYIEGYAAWFVIRAKTKRRAYSEGVAEFGRGSVKTVREATNEDVARYLAEKGRTELDEVD